MVLKLYCAITTNFAVLFVFEQSPLREIHASLKDLRNAVLPLSVPLWTELASATRPVIQMETVVGILDKPALSEIVSIYIATHATCLL